MKEIERKEIKKMKKMENGNREKRGRERERKREGFGLEKPNEHYKREVLLKAHISLKRSRELQSLSLSLSLSLSSTKVSSNWNEMSSFW